MRIARLKDLQRALARRSPNACPHLNRLEIRDLPGFEDAAIEPRAGFVAICGGTGAGKTAVLALLHAALEAQVAQQPLISRPRLGQATVTISIQGADGHYDETRSLSAVPDADHDGYPAGADFISLAARTSLDEFLKDVDIDVFKEGVEPFALDKRALDSVSAACAKPYDSVTVYELEADSGFYIPYFEVTIGQVSYNSTAMSTGELSVLYLAWALRIAHRNSIMLIEEPEAHIPPARHAAVFALIAEAAISQQLCVILTTHSGTIAVHVPDNGLISIKTNGLKSSILKKRESKHRALARLGMRPAGSAVLIVEDAVAADAATELLAVAQFDLVCNIEVAVANGDGGVKKAIEALSFDFETVHFVGVLDGDIKSKAKKWDCADKLMFLPFERPIETELLEIIAGSTARTAQLLGREASNLEDALNETVGIDHHDRFVAVAELLKVTEHELLRAGIDRWGKRVGKARLRRFASDLARILGVELI